MEIVEENLRFEVIVNTTSLGISGNAVWTKNEF